MAHPTDTIVNAMTVDVEDYFHASALAAMAPASRWHAMESRVCQNTDRILAILERTQVHATFFVLGWVGERFPDLVRRIARAGHEIASHGFHHQLVYDLSPDQFRADVRRTKARLEDIAGAPVLGYRAPSYSITRQSLWALDILIDEGYTYDASIFPIHHDRYGIPDAPRHAYLVRRKANTLLEIPPSTIRCAGANIPIAGGAYLRILPYQWTQYGISYLNQTEGQPAIVYVHPWEIDGKQPRMAASRLSRFRQYTNLDQNEARLTRLLRDFTFGPVRTAYALPRLSRLGASFSDEMFRPAVTNVFEGGRC